MVDKECDLTLSVDDIGRCTRRMCHRAVAVTFMQDEGDQDVAPPPAPAEGEGDDGEGDDGDDEDAVADEELN